MTSLWPTRAPAPRPMPVMPDIAASVATDHGLTVEQLRGPSAARKIAHARQEAFWRCRQHEHLSLASIGRFFGGRDHTTVLYGVRQYEARTAG